MLQYATKQFYSVVCNLHANKKSKIEAKYFNHLNKHSLSTYKKG